MMCILAETSDFSDDVTVTLNEPGNVPPTNSRLTITNCLVSDPVYWFCVNLTIIPNS